MIRETIRNYLGNLEILKTTWFFHKIATQWHSLQQCFDKEDKRHWTAWKNRFAL